MTAIAIDGPAGAGKSTIARALAQELGFIYVDTGALYRAIGLYAVRHGAAEENWAIVPALLEEITVQLFFAKGEQRVLLNGEDVSEEIRLPQIAMVASRVSAMHEVRQFLFGLQQEIAAKNNIVMDGRDIGTVVLPNAQVKIFLTASPTERAHRRHKELTAKGMQVDYDGLLAEVEQRDYDDSHRKIAPLKQAPDAKLFDTTHLNLQESIGALTAFVKEKLTNGV